VSSLDVFKLGGRVALITGGSKGLGFSMAKAMAGAGAKVVVVSRHLDEAQEAVDSIVSETGSEGLAMEKDVTVKSQVEEMTRAALERFGKIDILVNNAGLGPENPAEDVSEADFDLTLAVNLKGTFFVSQAVGRTMIKRGYGRIINLGSQAGHVALPGESIYCMTKAGINHLTKCLAVEWGKHNITVNGVAPTFIETPGTEACLSDPAFRADVTERIAALHRIGQPSDVTGAVVFLASSAASLITGHTIVIDGGWTAR